MVLNSSTFFYFNVQLFFEMKILHIYDSNIIVPDFRDSKNLNYDGTNIFKNFKSSSSVVCHSNWAVGRHDLEPGLGLPQTRWQLCKFGCVSHPLLGLDGLSWGSGQGWGEQRPP